MDGPRRNRGTALELADAVRDGRLSRRELLEQHIARIEAHNPRLSAFVELTLRRARLAATLDDRRFATTPDRRIFAGVPIGIKDIELVRATFTRAGSAALRWLWSPIDGKVARRIRRSGAIIIGKLATSELAILPVTEPDIHPATRNPWSPSHSAGGSSGGSGAAVAGGLLSLAHATDGAGSTRIPAAFAYAVGFKASASVMRGEYERRVDPLLLSSHGAISLDVDDAAAMLDVLVGRAHFPLGPASFYQRSRRAPARLDVRLCTRTPLCAVDPEIEAGVTRVAKVLEDLGHHVEVGHPIEIDVEEFLPLMQWMSAQVPAVSESGFQPLTRELRARGRHVSRHEIDRIASRLRSKLADWFGSADLWLTPTVPTLPPLIGELHDVDPRKMFRNAANLGAFTAAFNLSGQPAISIPAGFSRDGRPFGAQLAAREGRDAELLAVARQLEAALAWRQERQARFESLNR